MSIILDELKPKILVADDDNPTRMLLRAAITQWNYPVIEATDGEEAWGIVNNPSPPRILIIDWLMPKIDGITLCQKIKSQMTVSPYIILLTQLSGVTNVIKAIEAGADEFLTKPFNHAELRTRLLAGHRIISYEEKISEIMKLSKDAAINKHLNFIYGMVVALQAQNKGSNKKINDNLNLILESILSLSLNDESDKCAKDNVLNNINIIKNNLMDTSQNLKEISAELRKMIDID
jgi:CheY-like chemotaxis protein